jgi:hypothetical protein
MIRQTGAFYLWQQPGWVAISDSLQPQTVDDNFPWGPQALFFDQILVLTIRFTQQVKSLANKTTTTTTRFQQQTNQNGSIRRFPSRRYRQRIWNVQGYVTKETDHDGSHAADHHFHLRFQVVIILFESSLTHRFFFNSCCFVYQLASLVTTNLAVCSLPWLAVPAIKISCLE